MGPRSHPTPTAILLGCLLLLGACSDGNDDAAPAPTPGDSGGAGASGADDDGSPLDSGDPPDPGSDVGNDVGDDGSSAGGALVEDRCIGDGCAPVALPPQPELTLLEDMGDGWRRLMEADWALAPGSEGYRCMSLTLPEDVYITAFAPQSPPGTHHATFGVLSRAQGPDEVVSCGVGVGGERRLQGSGAGSEPSELPPGVAMRLRAGEQILMNLHLFNVSEAPLSGRSGMWVKTASPDEVEHEAEMILAGPLSLRIPAGARTTQQGRCTLAGDATIYGVGPHMHQLGAHMRVVAEHGGGETLLYDGDYDFSHQLFYDVEPLSLQQGDRVRIECTYDNDTDRTVGWGDSSLDEMCFVGLGLYPAIGQGTFPCTD